MLLEIWQNLPLKIDPIFFQFGSFNLRWYSIGYLLAFITAFYFFRKKSFQEPKEFKKIFGNNSWLEITDSLIPYVFIGMLLGAKTIYVLIYDWQSVQLNGFLISFLPFDKNWHFTGFYGLSFHGAVLGILISSYYWCKKEKIIFREAVNFVISFIPLAYFWGRLGNFMNGELFGRATSLPWGMRLPGKDSTLLYHPSQLYEAFGEGIILFLILKYLSNFRWGRQYLLEFFLIGYSLIRFVIEFFRQPDPQIGLVVLNLTMGQILSLIVILCAILAIIFQKKYCVNSCNRNLLR